MKNIFKAADIDDPGQDTNKFMEKKDYWASTGFLTQGLSCEKLALSIALGVILGTFPVLGRATILCMLAALTLRFNLPVIQFANYFVYPLQILLLVTDYASGAWFLTPGEVLTLTPSDTC